MSFLKRLVNGRVISIFIALVSGGLVMAPGLAGAWTFDPTLGIWRDYPGAAATSSSEVTPKVRPQQVQAKGKAPLATPATPRVPTDVEILNKSLNPGASDPNIPLPQPGLADVAGDQSAGNGPRIFGRGEQGGGVLGLKVPIPAERGTSGTTTRYGGERPTLEPGAQAR